MKLLLNKQRLPILVLETNVMFCLRTKHLSPKSRLVPVALSHIN